MMFFKMLYKSVMGMLIGICAGAMFVGIAAAMVGPQWVIGGMLLGAMAGTLLGTSIGFYKSIEGRERALQPQPVATRRPARVPSYFPAGGD